MEIICDAHVDHSQVIEPEHSRLYGTKQDGKRRANKRLSWYSVNNKLVLSTMRHGGGATDTATHLAYLDLPHSSAMGNKGFNLVELDIGKVLRNLAIKAMEEGLLEKIKLTPEEKTKQWGNQPHPKEEKPLTYDEY
eukprot:686978-Ditylum_brightwellii.AAC.1